MTTVLHAEVSAGRTSPDGTAAAAMPARSLQSPPVTLQPDRSLLRYYLLNALMFGPGFMIAVFPFYFRFRTLRYDVDEEGITMRWGILFRREISRTYARIQDIQLPPATAGRTAAAMTARRALRPCLRVSAPRLRPPRPRDCSPWCERSAAPSPRRAAHEQ